MNISSPNTANITLENWPESAGNGKGGEASLHFALKQGGLSLDFHLQQYFRHQTVHFHFFESLETLIVLCRRFPISAIFIGGKSDFVRELELVASIKHNVFLAITPVILVHPDPVDAVVIAAYENGVEEFIYGDWLDKLVEVRVRRVIERNRRDLSVNPSTMLPGPAIIEQELTRLVRLRTTFAVGYADLDNFKAYNDYYGYHKGDHVVKLTARIIKDSVFDLCQEGFVGHIAGDDFLFVVSKDIIEEVCQTIISTFDRLIPYRYDEDDRKRGYIKTKNRRGQMEQFPLLTLSIAVLINENGTFAHVGEMSRMLADLKKAVKQRPGSNYMVERRQKY